MPDGFIYANAPLRRLPAMPPNARRLLFAFTQSYSTISIFRQRLHACDIFLFRKILSAAVKDKSAALYYDGSTYASWLLILKQISRFSYSSDDRYLHALSMPRIRTIYISRRDIFYRLPIPHRSPMSFISAPRPHARYRYYFGI